MQTDKLQGIITFIRHGEKNSEGTLTQKGELQVLAKAINTKYLGGEIVVYHSGIDRVKRTVNIVRSFLTFTEDDLLSSSLEELISKQNLKPDANITATKNLHFLEDSMQRSNYYTSWDERIKANEIGTVTEFLAFNKSTPEPGVVIPPKTIAQRVCQLLVEQIKMVLESKTPVNIINGTHEPVLLAFASYLVNEGKDLNDGFLDFLGGPIKFAETADIEVYKTNSGFEYLMRFRHFQTKFTLEDLEKFILV